MAYFGEYCGYEEWREHALMIMYFMILLGGNKKIEPGRWSLPHLIGANAASIALWLWEEEQP
jgi:hypothetical protein